MKTNVTLVVGFLGAGKSTLVNSILAQESKLKIALIENEFGEIGIDQEIIDNIDDFLIEMSNGCLCCNVRADLEKVLLKFLDSEKDIDHILIEATGVANPGPILELFVGSHEIKKNYQVNTTVCVVDSYYFSRNLAAGEEVFKEQLIFADLIILNKVDLVESEEIKLIREKINEYNDYCHIIETTQGILPNDEILLRQDYGQSRLEQLKVDHVDYYPYSSMTELDLPTGQYKFSLEHLHSDLKILLLTNLERDLELMAKSLFEMRPILINEDMPLLIGSTCLIKPCEEIAERILIIEKKRKHFLFMSDTPKHTRLKLINDGNELVALPPSKNYEKKINHSESFQSISLTMKEPLVASTFQLFINIFLKQHENLLYRSKGILYFEGVDHKILFQGVYSTIEFKRGKKWENNERKSSLVFIGKELNRGLIEQGIKNCTKEI